MATDDKSEQVNNLINELEQSTKDSAAGTKSWDEFCKFLTNLETLAELHDPENIDVAELIKRKPICYHIASEKTDQDPERAAEILPRIEKLAQSEIFPNEADFFVLVDWLEQVTFLFELRRSSELIDRTLIILKALIEFGINRLRHEKIGQKALNWQAFDKTCSIAKLGLSKMYQVETNLRAVALILRLNFILNEKQFVTVLGNKQFEPEIDMLMWIGLLDVIYFSLNCINQGCELQFSKYSPLFRDMSFELRRTDGVEKPSAVIELLFEAVRRFLVSEESVKSDLAISEPFWIIVDYGLKNTFKYKCTSLSKTRIECLKIAKGLFGNRSREILEHIDLIINDTISDQSDDGRDVMNNVVVFLSSITCRNNSTRCAIASRLTKILEELPAECLDDNIIVPMIKAISIKNTQPLGYMIRMVALDRFRQIYQSGVEANGHAGALRSLYKVIATESGQDTSIQCEYIDIVAAGCQGLAPDGCNEAIFRILKKTRALVKEEDNQMLLLLPLAQAVYDKDDQ